MKKLLLMISFVGTVSLLHAGDADKAKAAELAKQKKEIAATTAKRVLTDPNGTPYTSAQQAFYDNANAIRPQGDHALALPIIDYNPERTVAFEKQYPATKPDARALAASVVAFRVRQYTHSQEGYGFEDDEVRGARRLGAGSFFRTGVSTALPAVFLESILKVDSFNTGNIVYVLSDSIKLASPSSFACPEVNLAAADVLQAQLKAKGQMGATVADILPSLKVLQGDPYKEHVKPNKEHVKPTKDVLNGRFDGIFQGTVFDLVLVYEKPKAKQPMSTAPKEKPAPTASVAASLPSTQSK